MPGAESRGSKLIKSVRLIKEIYKLLEVDLVVRLDARNFDHHCSIREAGTYYLFLRRTLRCQVAGTLFSGLRGLCSPFCRVRKESYFDRSNIENAKTR